MNQLEYLKKILSPIRDYEEINDDELGFVYIKTDKLLFTFDGLSDDKHLIDAEPIIDTIN